ncbi:hypothetical protein C9374_008482 [Naegleria lovaniensis]|uniref:Actin n=1 Tax=Naegleria lovaniensis TaxID=51637 RepID=A0AA88GFD3_NAELO|nr:uncharacterized protein C9374_008482 [Naegleria lovaniensis]KAG2378339.1 hypothetical protein C9374_008482 [Naegleria lovaniensis]
MDTKQQGLIMTECALTPKENREQLTMLCFEKFCIPAMYLANRNVMSLYGNGYVTGCSVNSGDSITTLVPVYEGFALKHASKRMDIGGHDLTMYLIKLLISEKGYLMTGGMSLIPIIQHIKETLCFVSNDFEREMNMSKSIEKTYELPDEMLITLDKESIQTSQPLFDPNFIPRDNDMDGLHSEIYHSVLKCDLDLRKELFSTISLSGGNCQRHGIEKRLERELQLLVPPSLIQCVKLVDERSRPHCMDVSHIVHRKWF